MAEIHQSEFDLNNALCNFCNGAADEWEPSSWAAETKINFETLCRAYNEWYAFLKATGRDPFLTSPVPNGHRESGS
jgi:hypothetical protein